MGPYFTVILFLESCHFFHLPGLVVKDAVLRGVDALDESEAAWTERARSLSVVRGPAEVHVFFELGQGCFGTRFPFASGGLPTRVGPRGGGPACRRDGSGVTSRGGSEPDCLTILYEKKYRYP